MSFLRTAARPRPSSAAQLEDRLRQELESPSSDANAQPIILAEPPDPAPISRLFVIWDDWTQLDQQDRSEIIMNAYMGFKGPEEALKVTVAMGLTSSEAARARIGIR